MKLTFSAIFCAVLLVQPGFADDSKKTSEGKKTPAKKPVARKKLPFESLKENISYAIGVDFGNRVYTTFLRQAQRMVKVDRKKWAASIALKPDLAKNLRNRGLEIVDKRLNDGFQAGLSGAKKRMDEAQVREVFAAANKRVVANQKERLAKQEKLGETNKTKGKVFLAANKKKAGVITTKSGLQYKVIRAGKGKMPKATDFVVTHYTGTLLDGTVFDSSVKRGIPATFQVGGVIKGWQEALVLMKKGAKWKLFIPSELAYRERGSGTTIGPHAVLIFEIELIDIKQSPKFSPRSLKR